MWKYLGNVLGVAIFLIVSCVLTYSHPAYAIPSLSDSNAKKIIEEGRNKEYILYAPTGDIRVAIISDEANPKNKLFSKKGMDSFKVMEKIGLLSITEKNGRCEIGRECYVINLTEKGKKVNVGADELGFYLFRIGEVKISKIVKNTEYKPTLNLNSSEEFRLVLCVGDFFPTEVGKQFYSITGEQLHKQYKFKVLLKYDPFKEKYLYVKTDWGYLDKDGFKTNRIE